MDNPTGAKVEAQRGWEESQLERRARAFMKDAHRNDQRGAVALDRWARVRNGDRRNPAEYVTTEVVGRAIELETEAEAKAAEKEKEGESK